MKYKFTYDSSEFTEKIKKYYVNQVGLAPNKIEIPSVVNTQTSHSILQ